MCSVAVTNVRESLQRSKRVTSVAKHSCTSPKSQEAKRCVPLSLYPSLIDLAERSAGRERERARAGRAHTNTHAHKHPPTRPWPHTHTHTQSHSNPCAGTDTHACTHPHTGRYTQARAAAVDHLDLCRQDKEVIQTGSEDAINQMIDGCVGTGNQLRGPHKLFRFHQVNARSYYSITSSPCIHAHSVILQGGCQTC